MRTLLLALTAATLLSGCGAAARPLAAAPTASVKALKAAEAFPGAGHVVQVDFGRKWDLHFASATKLTFTPAGQPASAGQAVTCQATFIRPGVWMVTWQEEDGTTVVHVEDYEQGTVHTNIGTPDGKFYNLKGSLKIVR